MAVEKSIQFLCDADDNDDNSKIFRFLTEASLAIQTWHQFIHQATGQMENVHDSLLAAQFAGNRQITMYTSAPFAICCSKQVAMAIQSFLVTQCHKCHGSSFPNSVQLEE